MKGENKQGEGTGGSAGQERGGGRIRSAGLTGVCHQIADYLGHLVHKEHTTGSACRAADDAGKAMLKGRTEKQRGSRVDVEAPGLATARSSWRTAGVGSESLNQPDSWRQESPNPCCSCSCC